jgi:hypothetical protein
MNCYICVCLRQKLTSRPNNDVSSYAETKIFVSIRKKNVIGAIKDPNHLALHFYASGPFDEVWHKIASFLVLKDSGKYPGLYLYR